MRTKSNKQAGRPLLFLYSAIIFTILMIGLQPSHRYLFSDRRNALLTPGASRCDLFAPAPRPVRKSQQTIEELSRDTDRCLAAALNMEDACVEGSTPLHVQLIFVKERSPDFYAKIQPKLNVMLKSIFATQRAGAFSVRLWSNDAARAAALLDERLKPLVNVTQWHATAEAAGTPFAKWDPSYLELNDLNNLRGGDLLRLMLLYKYGGLYLDTDVLLVRDVAPLLGLDFVTQWSCIPGKINGAIMFAKTPRSKFISLVSDLAFSNRESTSQLAWGTDILSPLFGMQQKYDFQVLPNCFFDPAWAFTDRVCHRAESRYDGMNIDAMFNNTFPGINSAADVFPGIFGYHWHNQWGKVPNPGSPVDLLFRDIESQFDSIFPATAATRRTLR